MLGVYIEAESRTNDGRIDAVAMCGEWIYLFEFKINRNAECALDQISSTLSQNVRNFPDVISWIVKPLSQYSVNCYSQYSREPRFI